MRYKLPYARAGQVVGLLGGSFDPAHGGHVHISRMALRHFGLDQLWWLVAPQNPLKPNAPRDMAARVARARLIMQHPRVEITSLEARLGTTHTAQTLSGLRHLYPHVRFIWLMGADNLQYFHHWKDWKTIVHTCPIGVLARRPQSGGMAKMGHLARVYSQARMHPALLTQSSTPAWSYVPIPLHNARSSDIRKGNQW